MKLDSKLRWWEYRREELLEVAIERSPILVWDDESINDIFFGTLLIDGVSWLFHSVRANSHKRVIEKVFNLGGGFRCQVRSHFDLIRNSLITEENVPVLSVLEEGKQGELVVKTNFPVSADGKESNRNGGPDWQEHIFLKILVADHNVSHNIRDVKRVFRGLYLVPSGYDQDPPSIKQLREILKKFLPYTINNTVVIVLNRQIGFELEPQEKWPDLEKTRRKIEELKTAYPHIEIWMDPEEFIFAHTGALFAEVVEIVERHGDKSAKVNLNVEVFHVLKNVPHQSYGFNFSSMQKLQESPLNLFPSGVTEKSFANPIPCYSQLKKGDIVIFPNAGMLPGQLCSSGFETNPKINFHYLCARRICQVNL